MKRSSRKEFATVNYMIYVQFSLLVAKNPELADDLLRYGFDVLYEKLTWLDRSIALQIVTSLRVPYAEKILDKIACDFLYQDYDDIMKSNIDLVNLIQLMHNYDESKYQRIDLWNKFEMILANIYT